MDNALDMSLDDIIKSKKSAGRGRGRGGAHQGRRARGSFSGGWMREMGRGAGRQGRLGVNTRPSSVAIAKSFRRTTKNFSWQNDLFEESLAAAGLPAMESGAKLYISNLDSGVSNHDIRELFSEIGELKRYAIHFGKDGRPSGSAEVVYARRSDAFAAHKRYNNVQLDGRPMKIQIVSPNSEVPVAGRVDVGGVNGKATRRVFMTRSRGRSMSAAPTYRSIGQRTRGPRNGLGRAQTQSRGMHGGRGQGRGRGRGKKQLEKSAEELDNELENYHAASMQIS